MADTYTVTIDPKVPWIDLESGEIEGGMVFECESPRLAEIRSWVGEKYLTVKKKAGRSPSGSSKD